MNVLLACDTSNRTNWGCRATSTSFRSMIVSAGTLTGSIDVAELGYRARVSSRESENVDFATLVANDQIRKLRAGGKDLHADLVARAVDRGRGLMLEHVVPSDPASFERVWQMWKSRPGLVEWLDSIADCDYVIVNGEGSIRKNDWSGRTALFLGWIASKHFHKPLVISNQMCDVGHTSMKKMVRAVYPLAQRLVFRGAASQAACQELLASVNAEVAPDAAFAYPLPEAPLLEVLATAGVFDTYPNGACQLDFRRPYVCIGASAIFQDGTVADGAVGSWFESLAVTLSSIVQVVLMGHDAPDQVLFEPIARRHDMLLINPQSPIPLVARVLRGASAYVGGRWHSGVLAASAGTPIVRLESNASVKSKDMDDFVIGPSIAESLADRPNVDALSALVEDLITNEAGLRAEGLELVAGYPKLALGNLLLA